MITVGMREPAQLQAQLLERSPCEQTFLIMAGQESVPVRTRSVGDQYIYSCLSAAAVALVMGIDLATVARGLEAVERVPGRMERIECGQPFSVFADSADTPDRLAVALKTLRRATRGRVLCAYSVYDRKRVGERPLMGRVA